MILPEQTAIQCFPRPQAGFGLRWGRGFCRFLRVVRRFAVTIFCGRGTGGGLTGGVQHRCFFVAGFWVDLGAVVCCGTVVAVGCGSAVAAGCGVGSAGTASFVSACRVGSGVGWVPACGRCSAKAAASTTAATTTARTIFSSLLFSFISGALRHQPATL